MIQTRGVRSRLALPARVDEFDAVVPAPFGAVGVIAPGDVLIELVFLPAGARKPPRTAAAALAESQLRDYLDGRSRQLPSVSLPPGSEFRRRVWTCISAIPAGATRTYGEIAAELGSSARAVGQACGDNPLPLFIPCHRVVAAQGPGGFAHAGGGFHQSVKTWLLAHER